MQSPAVIAIIIYYNILWFDVCMYMMQTSANV